MASGSSPHRIMIVDDEQDIAFVIKHGLETNGFMADAFYDAEEAIRAYQADGDAKYDMIITDIRMPKMNGFELYREIRKVNDKARVAFMTAFEIYDEEFQKVFPNIDVRCFIRKPVSIAELTKRINEELATAIL